MAVMGVRTTGGGGWGGGGLASLLMSATKAMYGDPEMEMKLAQMRSDLALDEYRKAQMQSVVDRNNALTQLDQYELAGRQGMVPAIAKIIGDRQAAVPVPVETPTPDVPIPTPSPAPRTYEPPAPVDFTTTEPDFRISTYPVTPTGQAPETPFRTVSPTTYDMPAPVDPFRTIAPTAVEGVEPNVSISTYAPHPDRVVPNQADFEQMVNRAMPVPIGELPPFVPSPALEGVPPDLQAADATTTAIPGRPTSTLYGDRPPPPSMDLPVPVTLGDRPPPPSLAEQPVGIQPAGATVEVPGRTTTEALPVQGPPVPVPEVSGLAAEPATATGASLPQGAASPPVQVMPGPQPNTVTVANKRGETMVLTGEELQALAQGLAATGTSASDISQAVGRTSGLVGLQYGDQSGAAQRQNALLYTGNLPSRDTVVAAGDTAGTNEAIRLAQATEAAKPANLKERVQMIKGQDGNERPYQLDQDANGNIVMTPINGFGSEVAVMENNVPDIGSTAESAKEKDFMNEVEFLVTNNRPVPPYLIGMYRKARADLYGSKTTSVQTAEGLQAQQVQQETPQGVLTDEQLNALGGAPVASGAAPAPAAPAVSPPAPAAPAAAPAVAPQAGPVEVDTSAETITKNPVTGRDVVQSHVSKVSGRDVKNYGGWWGENEKPPKTTETVDLGGGASSTTVTQPSGRGKIKEVGAETNNTYALLSEGVSAMKLLDGFTPGKEPGRLGAILNNVVSSNGGTPEQLALAFTDEKDRSFARAVYTFINISLRKQSGAAITPDEVAKYRMRLAQPSGQSWRDYAETRKNRIDGYRGMRKSLNGQIGADALRDLDTKLALATSPEDPSQGIDLDWTPDALLQEYQRLQGGGGGGGGGANKGSDGVWRE